MKLGMPYYLLNRTDSLSGSTDYVDMYQRLTMTVRCTARDASHAAYMIYDNNRGGNSPLAALEFGSGNSLGTVSFASGQGGGVPISKPMKKWVEKSSSFVGTGLPSFKFSGSDGHEYKWKQNMEDGQDWTCFNVINGRYIASYGADDSGNGRPGSQRILTLEEDFGHLGAEIIASLLIVRHIEVHGL